LPYYFYYPERKLQDKKLILHYCCAPCFGYVFELLRGEYEIMPFFYNPNIAPLSEYNKRLDELQRFCTDTGIELHKGEYCARKWTAMVKDYRSLGERSERCWICYEIRLEKAFELAVDQKADLVATTLSISPHKDAQKINNIWKRLSGKFGVEFLEADFKKNDGFKKSLEFSRQHGFYRQNYCGCIYSKMERTKKYIIR